MTALGAVEREGARVDAALATATRPIRHMLDDPRTIEIMLNDDGRVWVERAGEEMTATEVSIAPQCANLLLRHVASASERLFNRDVPTMAGTLPHWEARVQGWMPPVVKAPSFAIRMPAKRVYSLEEYLDREVISPTQYGLLVQAVVERKNILVGGSTGSGKTTFANALLAVVAAKTTNRVYIVEDTPELQSLAPNRLTVQTRPGVYDTQQAVRDALRARPDRIIVGELRDGTALDLLMAWNTGHPGGIATLHANSAISMLDRICELVELVAHRAPRERIAETIDLCVHLTLDPSSSAGRRLNGIVKVCGYDHRSRTWQTETVG